MAKKPPPPLCMLRGHEGIVTALFFTSEEDAGITANPSLISGSDTGEIIIWNLKIQRSYHKFKAHDGKMIIYLHYFKSSLISQGRDGLINVWKFVNNEWSTMNSFKCLNFGFCPSALLSTAEFNFLIAPTGDGSSLTFYEYDTKDTLYSYEYKTNSTAGSAIESGRETCMCLKAFTSDTNCYLLLGFDGGHVALWDYESRREKSRLKCHPEVVLCLDFDPNYKNHGISGSVDDKLQVWKKTDDDKLVNISQVTVTNPGINALKIRSDSKIVITAGQDCAIRIFSWKSLKPLAVLQYHTMPVISIDCYAGPLSQYKSAFVSGSKDKNIFLWSIY